MGEKAQPALKPDNEPGRRLLPQGTRGVGDEEQQTSLDRMLELYWRGSFISAEGRGEGFMAACTKQCTEYLKGKVADPK